MSQASSMMFPMDSANLIQTYARIATALGAPGVDPEEVLAQEGLTFETWNELEDRFDALGCSEELSDTQLIDYLGALAQGLSPLPIEPSQPSVDFESWLRIARACQSGAPVESLLQKHGVTLERFLSAQAHWLKRLVKDPTCMARYREATGQPPE
jgi:hypothetical protein